MIVESDLENSTSVIGWRRGVVVLVLCGDLPEGRLQARRVLDVVKCVAILFVWRVHNPSLFVRALRSSSTMWERYRAILFKILKFYVRQLQLPLWVSGLFKVLNDLIRRLHDCVVFFAFIRSLVNRVSHVWLVCNDDVQNLENEDINVDRGRNESDSNLGDFITSFDDILV